MKKIIIMAVLVVASGIILARAACEDKSSFNREDTCGGSRTSGCSDPCTLTIWAEDVVCRETTGYKCDPNYTEAKTIAGTKYDGTCGRMGLGMPCNCGNREETGDPVSITTKARKSVLCSTGA